MRIENYGVTFIPKNRNLTNLNSTTKFYQTPSVMLGGISARAQNLSKNPKG